MKFISTRPQLQGNRPFELNLSQDVCDRATRLAKSLFHARDAQVILVREGRAWRSRDPDGDHPIGPGARIVLETGSSFWLENALNDVRFATLAEVSGASGLRFYAAAPISLADGTTPGVLTVFGAQPQARDAGLARRLEDLAAFIADAWAQAQATREREQALETATRVEQRLTLAMEISDIHVWEMDYVRRELIKCGSEETFFAQPKTYDELAADIYCTIDDRDRPSVEEAWRRHVEDGAPHHTEYRIKREDGEEVWTSAAAQVVNDDCGRPTRLIGAMQNITKRKAAEMALVLAKDAAEAANRAKSAFLTTMSHEIRTPLNGVLGMAQAMAAEPLSIQQRERLNIIRQSGETLLVILNDILDLSKIEAGKLVLEEAEFDVCVLVHETCVPFITIAKSKELKFRIHVEPEVKGIYVGDASRIRQVLRNLISNAVKFTDVGVIDLTVTSTEDAVEFSVADTGVGVPADRLPDLFQKFQQVDASINRRYGGTGLGLAICRELAERLGGSIRADSVEGEGTTLVVRLPLVRVCGERPIDVGEEQAATADLEIGPIRILAAEDNTVNQLVLKTLLAQAGLDPFIVSDGAEAVNAWRDREWDVILMDVQMPGTDGLTACRLIRALELKLGRSRTPIIALTANAMAHQLVEYRNAGMDGFVAKPIEIRRLFAEIEAALAMNPSSVVQAAPARLA